MDKENSKKKKIVWLILEGCKLARTLESNLCNHPTLLDSNNISDSCHHIIRLLSDARHQLQELELELELELDGGPPQAQAEAACIQVQHPIIIMDMDSSSSAAHHANVTLTRSSTSSTPSQRPPRRKVDGDGDNRQTIQVAAPEFGNTDIPPEDGFSWKKYGQKEILGCFFPRSYYRCTHQKLYNCPAKKQVQRLDSNPFTYQVTYRGLHTCHLSPTPPPPTRGEHGYLKVHDQTETDPTPPPPISSSLPPNMPQSLSTAPGPDELLYDPLPLDADIMTTADAMFNTMDLIFSSSMLHQDSHHHINWEASAPPHNKEQD